MMMTTFMMTVDKESQEPQLAHLGDWRATPDYIMYGYTLHAITYNTMKYHEIPCNTMQYHASLITADGAYHCPVGGIRPFLLLRLKGDKVASKPILDGIQRLTRMSKQNGALMITQAPTQDQARYWF